MVLDSNSFRDACFDDSATKTDLSKLNSITATSTEINAVADLSSNGGRYVVKTISLSTPADDSETDTSTDLPAKAVLYDVLLDVTTAESTGTTKTLDVGTLSGESGGDANGFAAGIAVDSTGLVRPQATVTAGSNTNYYSANTRGALLVDYEVGTDSDTDEGLYNEKPYLTDSQTAKSVSTTAGSADFAEFVGTLILIYAEIA